ncbi:hypothetical protein C8R48DRAFT_679857 [Suillus tomentosus]|nr:hypothetical protein C8R48DRAFT_679857 [Suillus tomentosus]
MAPTPTIPPPTLPTVVLTFGFFELGVESPVSEVGTEDNLLGVGVEDPTLVVEVDLQESEQRGLYHRKIRRVRLTCVQSRRCGVEHVAGYLEDAASTHNIQELQLWNTVKSSILASRSNSPLDCDAITNVGGARQRVGYCIAALARFGSVEQRDLYIAHLQE